MKRISFFVLLLLISIVSALAKQPVLPVKVSENGRYFVDQEQTPVFWMGTTQWNLFREYSLYEAKITIESIRKNGFSFIQTMLLGYRDGRKHNVYGEKPWFDDDPLKPNEAYFKHIDSVIRIAEENNVIFSLTIYHRRYHESITIDNARAWAKWVAQRYRNTPNIVWSMSPEAKKEFVPILREIAAGLHEGDDGNHLITFKPDPSPYSSTFIHNEEWLDFNSLQTWKWVELIYPMVTEAYNRKPVKPILMGEGAYEHGSEYGFDVTPLWVRRQAYYSYLLGSHHTYGHNDSWRVLPTWEESLYAPGAGQLGMLRKIFEDRDEWWFLVPDQSIFASGGNVEGKVLNLAARHKDGKWVMVYLGSQSSFAINMDKLKGADKADGYWVEPKNGMLVRIGKYPTKGVKNFKTPEGWVDALLILEVPSE